MRILFTMAVVILPLLAPALSWQEAVGTHYVLYTNAFVGTTRSWPTPSRMCFTYDVTSARPVAISPVTGRFSGEPRFYDWHGTVGRTPELLAVKYGGTLPLGVKSEGHDLARYLREAVATDVDLVWNIGQISYDFPGLVNQVMTNKGAYFKDALYEVFKFSHTGEFADLPINIYWEIGNEINSDRRFSLEPRDSIPGTSGVASHLSIPGHAQDYLEYCLAPAVEALRTASAEVLGDSNKVKLLCGSLTWPRSPATQEFLRAILDGTVRGDHAPTLAGKKGYELIDAIAVHYTSADADTMESYYDEWLASGKVNGLWHTEELGDKGLGDFAIAQLTFRWFDFWADKPWDADRARIIFWGDRKANDQTETEGCEMELHLGQFFQSLEISKTAAKFDADGVAGSFALHAGENRLALFAVAGPSNVFRSIPCTAQVETVRAWHVPKDRPMRLIGTNLNFNATSIPSGDGMLVEVEFVKCAN